ncbi:hypothetical protein JST97_38200, partial [bacterium]|nr:hypothetical protein [bacterium]
MAGVNDQHQWAAFSRGVQVGNLFAFLDLTDSCWSWLQPMLSSPRRVFSLLGDQPTQLAGLHWPVRPWPELRFAGVQSAKDLFSTEETIHLLGYGLGQARAAKQLLLEWNGQEYARYDLVLNDQGLAVTGLRGLPAGDYLARMADEEGAEARFVVAHYQLSPLAIKILGRRYDPSLDMLRLNLYLEQFGRPISGLVEMAWDSGQELPAAAAEAGMLQLEVPAGQGSQLTFWLSSDPEATASLAVPELRQPERSPLVVSKLGREVTVSSLPMPGAQEVRGLFLHSGPSPESPVRIQRVDAERALLTCLQPLENLTLVLLDPLGAKVYQEMRFPTCAAGEELQVNLIGPAGVLALGAYVEGRPWEAWTALLRPVELRPRVTLPPRAQPGEEVTLAVDCAQAQGCLYLCVTDARHTHSSPLASRWSADLQHYLQAVATRLDGPQPPLPLTPPHQEPPKAAALEPAADPFGAPPADPFTPTHDPFVQQAQDPFAASSSDPFPASPHDPFAATDPFASPANNPFAAPAPDPFATCAAADPFGAPPADPFGAHSADPFAQQAPDPFAPSTAAADPFGAPSADP